MSESQFGAPQRKRRSDRYLVTAQPSSSAAEPQGLAPDSPLLAPHMQAEKAASEKKARPAPKRAVYGMILLALLLALAVAALCVVRGDRRRLHEQRQAEERAYAEKVAQHTVAYRDWIEAYAAENDIHPAFVAAIILRESSYNPAAESRLGARGLMQVMENTFNFVRSSLNEESTTFEDMFDPETNIRYGCWYLGYLSRIFNGRPIEMAGAYHAGPNNVKLWLMNYAADEQSLQLGEIPMADTRYYAGKVVDAYVTYYQHFYPDAT